MKIHIINKEKGRVYKSENIVKTLLGEPLTHDEKGSPEIPGGYISISDTRNYWACGVSDVPVGIDIEETGRSVSPSVVKRFHKDEIEYLAGLSEGSSEWKQEFLSVWVRKEAYMKLKGEGIRMGLSGFSVLDEKLAKSFEIKPLVLGVAGDFELEIERSTYDAPFEISCLECAAAMLDARMYSSGELRKKLRDKGYPEGDIEDALAKLGEYSYVDDENYAKVYAEKLAKQGKASRRIEYELQKKGIDKALARDVSLEYRESAYESALSLAESMRCNSEKDLARIGRKLASLGYETSLIYDILSKLKENLLANTYGIED